MKYPLLLLVACLAVSLVTSFQQPTTTPGLHVPRLSSVLGLAPISTTSPVPSTASAGPFCHYNHKKNQDRSPTCLTSVADDSDSSKSSNASDAPLDVDAMAKYIAAVGIQMSLFTLLFLGLDKLVAMTNIQVPFAVNFILFYFFALKSRLLNPLCNSRPSVDTQEISDAPKRKMPSWTPPGFVFPIVWLLLIGPLRAATTAMIYQTTGSYACLPILGLMLHLSIGDAWNTINNVERRYGTSVFGIIGVYTSAALAAFLYAQVLPLAGKLLALKLIWLTIASSLIVQTWRLNPNPETGKKYSFLPRKEGEVKTEFMWLKEYDIGTIMNQYNMTKAS